MRALVLAALLSGCAGREPMGPMLADAGEIADAGQLDVRPTDAGGAAPDVALLDVLACVTDGGSREELWRVNRSQFAWGDGDGTCPAPHVFFAEWESTSGWLLAVSLAETSSDGVLQREIAHDPPSLDGVDGPVVRADKDISRAQDGSWLWGQGSRCHDPAPDRSRCLGRVVAADCTITIKCTAGETVFDVHVE